jgi:hypothetical protein
MDERVGDRRELAQLFIALSRKRENYGRKEKREKLKINNK